MPLLSIIIALIIVGAVLYLLPRLPLDATIKSIIQVIVIVVLVIWLLRVFWPMSGLG